MNMYQRSIYDALHGNKPKQKASVTAMSTQPKRAQCCFPGIPYSFRQGYDIARDNANVDPYTFMEYVNRVAQFMG